MIEHLNRRVFRTTKCLLGWFAILVTLAGAPSNSFPENRVLLGQVFPPRQPQQAPQTKPSPEQAPKPSQAPPGSGPPGALTRTIPFAAMVGDPSKSFIQIANMRSAVDTNFSLGRSLAGRLSIDKHTSEGGNGKKTFVHVTGLSNPPIVSTEGSDLLYRFLMPTLQFKTYYQDYSGEGDTALGDVMAENISIEVRITPDIDQNRLPTYRAVRVTMTGTVKEAEKCTYFFDVIFTVNVCSIAEDYFKLIKPAVENGIRDILLQPQMRRQFEQQTFYFVRAQMLAQAGINPASPAQAQIIRANFQGADYVVQFLPR